jgi:anion-transporting  ArsA/GET3 family ATPase
MSAALDLAGYRLVICLGPGGVGKTTFSAGLALEAAIGGRRVDVMTIDPAPRLIDALGLEGDAAEPRVVDLDGLRAEAGGQLRASRLDPKRTFDDLIARHAPSAAARDAILAGRIYQNLSNALAGVADYMAMERVLGLYREGAAELIVLDTPPAHEALDFLDAPRRMLELMGSRAVALLSASRSLMRTRFGVLDLAARAVLAAFDRLTGLHLLADVQAFVGGFDGMYEGFAVRAAAAEELLRDPATLIVLVTTAEQERVAQAQEFVGALSDRGLHLGAVAVNRLMDAVPDATAIARAKLPAVLKRKLRRNLANFTALKNRELIALEALRASLPPAVPIIAAAELKREPRSLKELAAFAGSFATHEGGDGSR